MRRYFLIVIVFFVVGCANDNEKVSEDIIEANINGEILFKANCASCHQPGKNFAGPDLKGSLKRWGGDKKSMYAFIRNPVESQNTYAIALKKKWAPTIMTSFKLSNEQIDAIMNYVENYKATR